MSKIFGWLTLSVFLVVGNLTSAQDTKPVRPGFPGPGVPGRLATPATLTFPAAQSVPPGGRNPLAAVPQDVPPIRSKGPFGSPPSAGGAAVFGQDSLYAGSRFGMTKRERELNQKIQASIKAVKNADDSKAEATASKELRESLAGLFDERIKRRQDEIDKLKERLKELETKNDARKSRKDEIVDLKLKSMVNEAKGFGF